jgi:nucleoside-diphosphate-sugar epimerase
MRILVIGGSGFMGPFVVERLARLGHDVHVFHRGTRASAFPPGVRLLTGDRHDLVAFRDGLRALAPDVVVDIVLSSGPQAKALVDVFAGIGGRVVVVSSIDVYRACGVLHRLEPGPLEPLPLTESSALRTCRQTYPPSQVAMLRRVFGWLDERYDKIAVEEEIRREGRIPWTILRLPMVYGEGDRLHRCFPLLKRIADGRRTILFEERYAAWRGPRGYVENVAEAIALAATDARAIGRIYNVAEERAWTELEWARRVTAAAGWDGELVVLPAERAPVHLHAPGDPAQHWVVDSTRIRRELGYRETVALDEAIHRTVEWERAHPPAEFDAAQFDYAAEDAALG